MLKRRWRSSVLFEYVQETKKTLSLGELFTLSQVSPTPTTFTGGVLVVAGASDFIFCGGNCTQILPGTNATLVQAVHGLYPMAANFSAQVIPNTAHALNVHLSAPSTYTQILDFVASRG